MEEKKRFINPVTWAKHCFILVIVELSLILVGLTFSLTGSWLGPNNGVSNFFDTLAVPLSFVFYILLPAIFIGGTVAFFGLLIAKERTIKPYIFSIVSVTASGVLFCFVLIGIVKGEYMAMEILCRSNMKGLSKSVLQASQNNDNTFTKDRWCDLIKDKISSEKTLQCYLDNVGPCSYAMNENIPVDAKDLPGDLVLLFESAPGWNQTGGADDVVTDRHGEKNPGANIAFANGHVEFVKAEDIPKLRWKIKNEE